MKRKMNPIAINDITISNSSLIPVQTNLFVANGFLEAVGASSVLLSGEYHCFPYFNFQRYTVFKKALSAIFLLFPDTFLKLICRMTKTILMTMKMMLTRNPNVLGLNGVFVTIAVAIDG